MIGTIELENIEFNANHGCFCEERIIGGKFLVSLCLSTDISKASVSDNINDALNYQTVYDIIKEEIKIPSNLLEHVSTRILDALYVEFGNQIITSKITVSKINPPLGGKVEKVSLSISR